MTDDTFVTDEEETIANKHNDAQALLLPARNFQERIVFPNTTEIRSLLAVDG